MRTIIILAALPLAACGSIASGNDSGARAQASGSGTTRSFAVADFTGASACPEDPLPASGSSAVAIVAITMGLPVAVGAAILWFRRRRDAAGA